MPCSLSALYLDALLRPSLCNRFGDSELMVLLLKFFTNAESQPNSEELTRVCILGYINCASDNSPVPDEAVQQLIGEGVHERLLKAASSSNSKTAPYFMRFIWLISDQLLCMDQLDQDCLSLLRSLCNSSSGRGLPSSIGGMDFVKLWINGLENMCKDDPESVIGSGILSQMIRFYEKDEGKQTCPQLIEIQDQTGETVLAALRRLENTCHAVLQAQHKGRRGDELKLRADWNATQSTVT